MATPALTAPAESDIDPNAARTARHLATLDRLEAVGMSLVDRIERVSSGTASEAEAALFAEQDVVLAFTRVARAVRQIIVLSQETIGLRAPPGSRGLSQGGTGTGNARSAPAARRFYGDYRDYSDEDRREYKRHEAEVRQRIEDELQRIHDRLQDEDDTPDPEDDETEEIEERIFGIRPPGTPPFGRGPP